MSMFPLLTKSVPVGRLRLASASSGPGCLAGGAYGLYHLQGLFGASFSSSSASSSSSSSSS
eukprot:CAMPEP_0205951708 /NCGR_PEP_ID=MMETSP1459-20131121/3123_1 /ASSEMBLY_ACC=CAM_ASM_001120 /TAXON_ID=41880 /ORGANISM="Pycnococcus provasolii, Strain RCC931" /LENGTH=60 /DNA_ID=CAMNT_0053323441 /DNA_START=45 /DNA_END=224 /DNA_ORIENTATION=+